MKRDLDNKNEGKNTERRIREICEKVLERTMPSEKERRQLLLFSEKLVKDLGGRLKRAGVDANIQIQGSIAKDTWLAGEKDIDLFITLPKKNTREVFKRVLDVVKDFLGKNWVECYAEHPYIEAEVGGYKIDFVPCFKIKEAEKAASSVDRTPLHTAYIKENLNQDIRNEVRLLKQFMRGIGVYGAEIKVGGFSGYLCELLILNYKSFIETIKKASKWRVGEIIDIERAYMGKVSEAKRLFRAPLIVVDPVDLNRNVAAAVSLERLGELITASREFLKRPRLSLFYPPETRLLSTSILRNRVSNAGFDLVALAFKTGEMAPDVLWGQLYKTLRSIRSLLTQHGFKVLRASAWSDEEEFSVFILGLESSILPHTRRHLGPHFDSKEAGNFLRKHLNSETTVMGPWIEGNRWVVGVKRMYVDAVKLLWEKLMNGGAKSGVARMLTEAIKTSLEIKVNEEIMELYSSNEDFAKFLIEFIRGKPKWLD